MNIKMNISMSMNTLTIVMRRNVTVRDIAITIMMTEPAAAIITKCSITTVWTS